MKKNDDLLRQLSEATGPSGHEESLRHQLEELWRPLVTTLRSDAMGNLIAMQQGTGPEPRPAVMAAAHMDEIGLIVTQIEEGFLHIAPIGGTDRRVLLGLEVLVHGREDIPGLIGTRPPHVLSTEERKKTVPWEKLFVDVGLPAEKIAQLIRVGDPISIRQPLLALENKRFAGKALDNRASVVALTLALAELVQREHAWDFYAVATVQEEVGLKGAITSAYGVDPQLAVALDVTFAKQEDDSKTGVFALDKGPTIGLGPNFHPQLFQRIEAAAKELEIPYQLEPTPGASGTDAWGIQVAREGIPTSLLSIPVRYMHQPVETLAWQDVERTGRLLAALVAGLESTYRPGWENEGDGPSARSNQ
ncbi:MAG: M42 family metallopeptidase [Chloroflexota bacterium]|nr:M42 family metallopeptidase [Chloroflexota bacterium]